MCKTLLFGVLLVFPFFLHAQEITDIEKLLQDNDVEASEGYYEDIVATLLNLAAHPINIGSFR